jgi:hypothetical protein
LKYTIDITIFLLGFSAAGKGQQVLYYLCCTEGLPTDSLKVPSEAFIMTFPENALGEPQYRRQRVVNLVGNPSSQLTNSRQLAIIFVKL